VVHFYRNVFSVVPTGKAKEVAAMLKAIHAQEDLASAREKATAVAAKLRAMKLAKAAEKVETRIEETLTYMHFPREHWIKIRTNNGLERLNREIRRRTRVVGSFPDGHSALMLVCARLRHVASSNWGTKRYLNMERLFETEVMNRIADGLTSFNRIVVTADHGASRLAVIARRENKGETLPWDGQPDDWRYSLAPQGAPRSPKLEQEYFPETKKTYWIVRGYNRLPKMGGKLYELHGGASLEERLVPIVVFTRNAATEVPKQLGKEAKAEIVDEFEGLI
jgi:hypothetical protein